MLNAPATGQVFYAGGQLGPGSMRAKGQTAVVHAIHDMQDVSDGKRTCFQFNVTYGCENVGRMDRAHLATAKRTDKPTAGPTESVRRLVRTAGAVAAACRARRSACRPSLS